MSYSPITTDAAGNLYGVGYSASYTTVVFKVDSSGNQVGSFDTKISAGPQGGVEIAPVAITVDEVGAIYLTGNVPSAAFPVTPGAYHSITNGTGPANTDIFVIKVASTLDRVIYAALIGGDGVANSTAIAVDGAGEAWVAGWGEVGIANPFPLTDIGLPVSGDSQDAFVLKLSADGSSLICSAGLGAGAEAGSGARGSALSLVPLPDGSVQALVQFQTYGAAVVTLGSAGDAITREQFLPHQPPPPNTDTVLSSVALAPGLNGGIRVLLTTMSSGFPVAAPDEGSTPLIVDLPATVPSADISVGWVQLWPWACSSAPGVTCDYLGLRAVITNHGPDDAEAIQVTIPTTWNNNVNAYLVECVPNGVAICQGPGLAMIPTLPAGTAMSIDFVFSVYGWEAPQAQPTLGALALTSDGSIANNFVTITPQIVSGSQPMLQADPVGVVYRSDAPGGWGTLTADPALSVWGPSPQAINGNMWYFDSWSDGNTDNPRVFDASNGIPLSQEVMNFRAAQPIGADPSSLDFVVVPGSTAPATRSITLWPVARAGYWSMKLGTPGASWVTLNPLQMNSGQTGATLTGAVNVAGLAPGYYTTTVPVSLDVVGSPEVTENIPISLRIASQPPVLNAGGIVNAASYQGGSVVSGEIITIFGSGLGPQQLVQAAVPQAGDLPTSLAGTRVLFITGPDYYDVNPAPLLYVQDGTVSAIVPPNLYPFPTTFTVELGGAAALTTTVQVGSTHAPGLFTLDESGTGNLAAVNADGTINSPLNPARRGSMVLLYATGIGTDVLDQAGLCVGFGSNQLITTLPVEVSVGGEPALVLYSGSAPGMTCAAQQINIIIPEDSQTGAAVPIRLSAINYAGATPTPAQNGLTLAIQ
ncbi:MAG: hypothetical protein ABSH42_03045 [Bryobacteraceae bacterium]